MSEANVMDEAAEGNGLAAEVERVRQLASEMAASLAAIAERIPSDDSKVDLARRAKAVYRSRRLRDAMMPSGIFSDPAWDILLDVFIAELEGVELSTSSVCLSSNAPPTTALRYISALERQGALVRKADPTGGRRQFVSMSPEMRTKMTEFFEQDLHVGV